MLKEIKKIIDFFSGKKTYISGVLIALIGLTQAFNLVNWTPEQFIAVESFIGALGLMSLRAGIEKTK